MHNLGYHKESSRAVFFHPPGTRSRGLYFRYKVMEHARWQRIKEILDEALERPPEERAAHVEAACAGDAALRREVEALLASYAQASQFFGEMQAPAGALLPQAAEREGSRVGAYRLVEEIGRGGMGTVYRAERADGTFEQTVAVKLLRYAFDREGLRQRFLSERQILASLQHPGIAALHDGGVTDGGRPYFVMELVEGTPIDAYCDAKRLSVKERLRLFGQVAEAVQHAHQRLVIHRDLKPSNILVTEDGRVKLLDFGIAKLLDADAAGAAVTGAEAPGAALPHTRTGQHLMTPEYAAPEQVTGGAITTATDVYQLGILLYELLTGHRPYRAGGRAPYEVIRAICEEEPTRPSTIVTQVREVRRGEDLTRRTPEAVGRGRQVEAARLRQMLRGDLDAIILKALRKEPERRYATVEALRADLRAYRGGVPVSARSGTWAYRTRKFVRRHRFGLATALLFVLLAAGFGALYAVQMQQERNRAQAEAAKAQAVTAFMVELFEETDPLLRQEAGTPTVGEVLQRGSERVRSELSAQPAVQSELMTVIGRVYTDLGQYPAVEPLLREALRTRRLTEAPALVAAETMTALAYMLFRQERYDEAEALYRDALAQISAADEDAPIRITALNGLALVLDERGEAADAAELYREAIARAEAVGGEAATMYHNLAIALGNQGRFEEALAAHERALAAYREQYGAENPRVASALARMAFTYHRAGEAERAEALYREALDLRRRLLPPGHPHTAASLVRLGWLLVERSRAAEAEPLAREGLVILQELLPPDHWQIAAARGVVGLSQAGQGRFEAGVPPLEEAFRTFNERFGPSDWRTRQTAAALAKVHAAWGKPEQAAPYRALLAEGDTAASASR